MTGKRKPYTRDQIVKRDGSKCWLCGNAIDITLKTPHPLSLTMDHVVPLSRGGTDVAANVACAHKICNEVKKDRMPSEFFGMPEGVIFRNKQGKTALLLVTESDDDLVYIVRKLGRTRNKGLKKAMLNIINQLQIY